MRAFGKRMLAYILLGTALALAVGPLLEEESAQLAGLDTGRWIAAGVLAVAGLWLMAGMYKRRPGFNVSPAWTSFLVDLIIVVAAGMGSYILLEWLFDAWLGLRPMLGDEAVQVIMAIMYLPSLAILAGFASNAASQSLEVGPEGLTRHGPGRSQFIPWDKIDGIGLEETHLMVARSGAVFSRKFQTKLVIKTGDDEITLFEPALKDTKREMLAAMRDQGPERLAPDLKQTLHAWT